MSYNLYGCPYYKFCLNGLRVKHDNFDVKCRLQCVLCFSCPFIKIRTYFYGPNINIFHWQSNIENQHFSVQTFIFFSITNLQFLYVHGNIDIIH